MLIDGDAAHEREQPRSNSCRVHTGEDEQRSLGRADFHDGRAIGDACEECREPRLESIVIVSKVTGAEYPSRAVLELEHGESAELHRSSGPIEEERTLGGCALYGEAEPIIVGKRRDERMQPRCDVGVLSREVLHRDAGERIYSTLVLRRHARRDLPLDTNGEERQREERRAYEGEEKPGAEAHG
jgi:hypothetical protein